MLIDRIALGQLLCVEVADQPARRARVALAQTVDGPLLEDVLAPRQGVSALVTEQFLRCVGEDVLRRHRHDVGRRSLQHRDVAGLLGHRRHQRDSGGATADHNDLLARVVEVRRPVLRVHDLPLEALAALEVRGEAFVVAVVAAGAENPGRADLHEFFGVGALDIDNPARVVAGPRRAQHLVVEAHLVVDAVFGCGLTQIGQDFVGGGDGVVVAPRLELVTEGVQIGVRADAGVAEQIPGAAGGAAGLQDGVGLVRVLFLQVVGGTDAGNAGADDEYIDMLDAADDRCGGGHDTDSLRVGGTRTALNARRSRGLGIGQNSATLRHLCGRM